ncbi:MAG TPA: HD domain-containing protein [Anaerolineae bacterium]|nr:HD domain-containing protein [Anaerolineae bacterium]
MISAGEARRRYPPSSDPAHDFDHVLRVTALAERIARAEGADVEIVRAAALLHDLARGDRSERDHAEAAARQTRAILESHPPDRVEAVARAIEQHRFRSGPAPDTLEARCLFDADKLDSIGATGVARAFAYSGVIGQRLWDEVEPDYAERFARGASRPGEHTSHHEFVVKLSRLRERMTTATGRAIADERHAFMLAFYERLAREMRAEA